MFFFAFNTVAMLNNVIIDDTNNMIINNARNAIVVIWFNLTVQLSPYSLCVKIKSKLLILIINDKNIRANFLTGCNSRMYG